MEFKEIQELIKLLAKSDIGEVKIKQGDFQISIKSNGYVEAMASGKRMIPQMISMPAPQAVQTQPSAPQAASQPSSAPQAQESQESKTSRPAEAPKSEAGHVTIKSPMIGTFYRASSPDKDPFVKVGDTIQKGDVLCIIEAMKLFNEIESEFSGKIIKVLVEDSSPVEYDQPLFLIDPNAA